MEEKKYSFKINISPIVNLAVAILAVKYLYNYDTKTLVIFFSALLVTKNFGNNN